MNRSFVEFWVGVFVVGGICAIALLAFQADGTGVFSADRNYKIYAKFNNIGGLRVKAPVTIAGVTVGRVSDISVDMDEFSAQVEFAISEQFDSIPVDSSARIVTAGLLGAQYISLEQGAEDIFLQSGDVIEFTQSSLRFEDLIGEFLVNQGTE